MREVQKKWVLDALSPLILFAGTYFVHVHKDKHETILYTHHARGPDGTPAAAHLPDSGVVWGCVVPTLVAYVTFVTAHSNFLASFFFQKCICSCRITRLSGHVCSHRITHLSRHIARMGVVHVHTDFWCIVGGWVGGGGCVHFMYFRFHGLGCTHIAGNLGRPVAPHDRNRDIIPQATGCSAEKTRCVHNGCQINVVQWTSNLYSSRAVRQVQHTGCQINAVLWTANLCSKQAARQVPHTGHQTHAAHRVHLLFIHLQYIWQKLLKMTHIASHLAPLHCASEHGNVCEPRFHLIYTFSSQNCRTEFPPAW